MVRRIGHKGADAIVPGNTIASFEQAVEIGVEMIELDVLWRRDGSPELPAAERSPLVVAHDWEDAARREPHTLDEALAAFREPPLDRVELDLDLKLPGREAEVVAALREHELVGRAMVSTMYTESIDAIRELEPELQIGWTYPKVTRPWDRRRWARPGVVAALAAMRLGLPRLVRRRSAVLRASELWAYDPLITTALRTATRDAGLGLVAWTVDDPARISALRAIGVDGICTNDPRLLR